MEDDEMPDRANIMKDNSEGWNGGVCLDNCSSKKYIFCKDVTSESRKKCADPVRFVGQKKQNFYLEDGTESSEFCSSPIILDGNVSRGEENLETGFFPPTSNRFNIQSKMNNLNSKRGLRIRTDLFPEESEDTLFIRNTIPSAPLNFRRPYKPCRYFSTCEVRGSPYSGRVIGSLKCCRQCKTNYPPRRRLNFFECKYAKDQFMPWNYPTSECSDSTISPVSTTASQCSVPYYRMLLKNDYRTSVPPNRPRFYRTSDMLLSGSTDDMALFSPYAGFNSSNDLNSHNIYKDVSKLEYIAEDDYFSPKCAEYQKKDSYFHETRSKHSKAYSPESFKCLIKNLSFELRSDAVDFIKLECVKYGFKSHIRTSKKGYTVIMCNCRGRRYKKINKEQSKEEELPLDCGWRIITSRNRDGRWIFRDSGNFIHNHPIAN